jgi:hypothetical protein
MVISSRKFYRTVIEIEVLSEEPIPDAMELGTILAEGDNGGYSLTDRVKLENEEVDGPTMAKLLEAQASDPGFFNLTANGEDADEDDDEEDDDAEA